MYITDITDAIEAVYPTQLFQVEACSPEPEKMVSIPECEVHCQH